MVAVNSAIEVDLMGQVCSDSMGCLPFSGIGGQGDFIRGAARSRGGLPIIALPSTAKSGAISRIVPTLRPGAGAVTSRGDVHWVITEHGAAYLHDKCLRERAEAMIAIADPHFRDELARYALQAHLLGASMNVVMAYPLRPIIPRRENTGSMPRPLCPAAPRDVPPRRAICSDGDQREPACAAP